MSGRSPKTNGIHKPNDASLYLSKPVAAIISNGFFTVDREWTVKYWNKTAERLLGVPAENIVGKNLWGAFAGVIPLDFYAFYHKAFQQEAPLHFTEYWGEMNTWVDVIAYHCDDILSVSFKSSNEPLNPEYASDPTHPVQQLKIMTEMYRLVTEVTNDALWEWDFETKEIFWIDGGHKRLFGYQIENALVPQSFWESCVHPDDLARILTRLDKIANEGEIPVWEEDYRFRRAGGQYAYIHDRGHIIYDKDNIAIRMIGATQDVTSKVEVENKLAEERRSKLKEITAAVIDGQENERATIGRELHDNLNQVLAVVTMYIQMARTNEAKKDIYLEESGALIKTVIENIRAISKTLVIPGTHIIGLFDNVKNMIHDLMKIHPLKLEFSSNNINEYDIDDKLQLNIYRIVQEQVNNILKHANAENASIKITGDTETITLVISDNGNGCLLSTKQKGVGIINIQSRADLYDGIVTIKTRLGKGYELRVVFPVK